MNFFDELKRRNVIKATMAYIVIAWVLTQVFAVLLPAFKAPEWVFRTLIVIMVIGLPVWIVFSWVYEVTPEGLKRTANVSKDDSITAKTNKRLNIIILVVLLIAIAVNFVEQPVNRQTAQELTSGDGNNNSVAVIPFIDISPNQNEKFYSDGITIEILNALCRFEKINVVGQTSSFSFKNKNEDLRSIGEKLGVNYILEGSVQKQENLIRISVRLTDTDNGYTIFSESYTDLLENIFNLQSEIAMDIAEKVGSEFALEDNHLYSRKKINPLSYETFLKGQSVFVNGPLNMKKSELIEAKKYFKRAIELDPNFAEANAYLSLIYFNLADWGLTGEGEAAKKNALDSAKLLAKRSHELDSLSSGAHLAMGSYYFHDFNWIQAETEKRKAVELNPGGAQEKLILAHFLMQFGQGEEALDLFREAIKLDPLYPPGEMNYLWGLYFAEKFDEAIAKGKTLIQDDLASEGVYQCLFASYMGKNQTEEARKAWIIFSESINEHQMADFFRENDFTTAIQKTLAYDEQHKIELFETLIYKASFYAFIYDKENTLKYLYESYDKREPDFSLLRLSRFDLIKDDPRYLNLYEMAGFKAYDDFKKEHPIAS